MTESRYPNFYTRSDHYSYAAKGIPIQAGFSVANTDRTLTRDNKGPRAGRGFAGRIDK